MILSFDKSDCIFKLDAASKGSLMCNDEKCILCRDEDWDWPESFRGVEIHAVPGKSFIDL